MTKSAPSIPPSEYSQEYFLTACEGHEAYLVGKGVTLVRRLQAIWRFLRARPGLRVLDVGCGRGEIVAHSSVNGVWAVGIDYSKAAVHLAQQTMARVRDLDVANWVRPGLSLGNAKKLPFRDSAFDRVIMSDIVEHLHPPELEVALTEAYRVLAPGGALLIHTMPNLWYYHYGYPVFRLVRRLQGVPLPIDPRDRFRFAHVHINEQTPRTLRRALANGPFANWRVWLYDYRAYTDYALPMRWILRALTTLPILRRIFCDDIFALAWKGHNGS